MLKTLISASAALFISAVAATSATFNYDVVITDISGDGSDLDIGFFSTGMVGDTGLGSARTDFDFPTTTPMQFNDDSLFRVAFPGVATAASFFANPVVHDPTAGTVTVSGFLGGITGPYLEFLTASAFEFIYTGTPGAITSLGDYETFLAGATMSGFASGTFILEPDFENPDGAAFTQRIDFAAARSGGGGGTPPAVPLPAGGVLLLSGLGLIALKRRNN